MVGKSVITQLRLHTSSHLVSNIYPSPQCIVSVALSSGRFSTRHVGSRGNFFDPCRVSGDAASHLIPQLFLCIISASFLEIVVILFFKTKEMFTSAGSICVSLINVVDITHSDAPHLVNCYLEVTPERSSTSRHEPWIDAFNLQFPCKHSSYSLHARPISRNYLHCELASHRVPITPPYCCCTASICSTFVRTEAARYDVASCWSCAGGHMCALGRLRRPRPPALSVRE